MPTTEPQAQWSYEYRPRLMPRVAIGVAVVLVVVHAVFGALLTISDTGPDVGLSDQIGVGLIGVVEAAAVLLLTRARLRIGPDGVGVRNLVPERVFGWDEIDGLVYPEGKWCARLLLPADEHIPVLAIQARDGDRAVAAMEQFRALRDRHAQDGQ